MFKNNPRIKFAGWQTIFCLWSIQGLIAFTWLLLLPTNTKSEVALGFSAERLALFGSILLLTGGSIFLFIQAGKITFLNAWLDIKKTYLWDLIYLLSLNISFFAPIFILILFNMKGNDANASYAMRLSPLAFWAMLSGIEMAIFLAYKRREGVADVFQKIKSVFRSVVIIFAFVLILSVLISSIKIVMPDNIFRESPIPSFEEWQIVLTLLIIAVFSFFPRFVSTLKEKWIVIGVYILTLILWLSQPVNPSNYATPPRVPNFEIYPFSDPLVYAQYAQSALVGNGFFWPDVPARPFYVAFLAWLHLFGVQKYNNVILLQTLVLGFFPVALYLLGRAFGGRSLGLGLALLTIFRDINANHSAPFGGAITYSKLLLSELPTALLISLVALISFRWIRSTKQPAWLPLLTGGVLGVATLVRTQSLILLGVIILIAFLIIPTRRQWLVMSGCLILGTIIALAPWLTRNYMATGGLILDDPLTQTMTMTRRWTGSEGNEIIPRLPNESDSQYSNRMMRMAFDILKSNPGFILKTAASHLISSEIGGLLLFPVRGEIQSPAELLWPQHVVWKVPRTINQLPFWTLNFLFFSIGVVASYRHHHFMGLLPLGFNLAYNSWSALFFSSGSRFIVPVDWCIHLYQIYGLLILGGLLLVFTHGAKENVSTWLLKPYIDQAIIHESTLLSRRRSFQIIALILFLGAFVPFTEMVFPKKYPIKSQEEIAKQIGIMPENGEIVLYGRALYPRYYNAGDGEPDTAKIGYEPNEKPRLIFFLVGTKNELVVFELKKPPEFFPHTSDVLMIGTQAENYFSPRVVKAVKDSRSELYINK